MLSNERPSRTILGAFSARVNGEMFLIFQASLVTARDSLSLSLSLFPFLLFFYFLPWPKHRQRSASRFKLASLDARKCHVMMASIAHCIRCPSVQSSRLQRHRRSVCFLATRGSTASTEFTLCAICSCTTNPFDPPKVALSQKMRVGSIDDGLSTFPLCAFRFIANALSKLLR